MVDSLYSLITNVEQAQSQKEVTINEGFDRISSMMAATLIQSMTAGDFTPTSTNPTPEWQANLRFELTGTPGVPRLFIAPSGAAFCKLFIVQNDSDSQVTVQVGAAPTGTLVLLATGDKALLYSDGTDVILVEADVPVPVEDFIYVPVEERVTPTAAGGSAVLATVATAANQPDVTGLDFDQTTAEHAQLRHVFELVQHLGNVSFQFVWSHAAATTFGLAMNVKGVAVSNDGTLATAFGTARKIIDTGGTTDDHYLTDRTGFVKVTTPAELDFVIFDLFRDPVDAGDDLDVDARLQGVIIHYWRNNPLDPDWASVSLMAGFDGEDAATDLDDESDNGHVATYVANAQIDTAQSKFSRASLLLDGTGDVVTFPDSADFALGSGDFTLEGYFRWNTDPAVFQMLTGQFQTASSLKSYAIFRDGFAGDLELFLSTDGSTSLIDISAAFTPVLGQQYHVAVDFDGTTYRLYVDGTVLGTSTTLRTLNDPAVAFSIGAQANAANPFDGHVDELRLTKGVARYAGKFNTLTAPFPRA